MDKKKNKLFLALAIFSSIGIFVGITEQHIPMTVAYLVFAIIFFYLWNKKVKNDVNLPTTEITITEDVTTSCNISTIKENIEPQVANTLPIERITKNFRVAGVSYRQSEIESLAIENPDFTLSKRELSECYVDGDKIYKYDFFITDAVLEPEPTNEYDQNAIKVIANNIHIGYIKSGKCAEVRNLLNSGKKLSIDIEIYGGPYKEIYIDDDDNVTIEKDSNDYSAKVTITYNK